jgi:excisionase family DNA binding protein
MTLEREIERIVRRVLAERDIKPANDSPLMSVAEAAAFARVSPGTVRRWVRRGELTKHEAGARVLVKRDELESFLARGSRHVELSPEEQARRRFG